MNELKPSKAFYNHLAEAIDINTERKALYAKMSNNKSLWISRPLILLEKASKIVAIFIDHKAEKYQKAGIPIITNDFVPMHPLPAYDTPPLYRKGADSSTIKKVDKILKNYSKALSSNVLNGDFQKVAQLSYDTLEEIKNIETTHQCHFAMTRHLIESIGFQALHSMEYEKASQGNTKSLSKTCLRFQALGISGGLWLDKQAQPLHQMGVGIIINDVPHIPFESEFQAKKM